MTEMYNFGLQLIEAFSEAGDWLLTKPLDGVYNNLGFWATVVLPDATLDFLEQMQNFSVADMIIGGGLTFILGYKLISFFLDLLP